MDIQGMVDRRIAELESESTAVTSRPGAGRQGESFSPGADRELREFSRMIDAALAQVAAGVLEVSERMAADYTRLEKSILKSRLEALDAIESVLDITLRLRSEIIRRLSTVNNMLQDSPERQTLRAAGPTATGGNQRSDMRDGMAALFKRTL